MSDLIDLLETDFFRVGLRAGLVALGVGWVLALLLRNRWRRPLPMAGLLIGSGLVVSLVVLDQDLGSDLVGLSLIVGGALLARFAGRTRWVAPVAVLPGAVWLAVGTTVTDLTWVRVALVILIPVAGFLISDFEERYDGLGLGVIFYTLAVFGVFVAVPDTEWARALVAIAFPVTFLAWPKTVASLGPEGSYLVVAILVMVAAEGGGSRPASIVGSIACLGLLVIEPVLMAFKPSIVALTSWFERNWAGAIVASLPQFAVVAVCSRVAARFTGELPALIIVALVYGAAAAIGVSIASSEGLRDRVS